MAGFNPGEGTVSRGNARCPVCKQVTKVTGHGSRRAWKKKLAQFYLTYHRTYLDNKIPFDDVRKIASAEGVDLEQLWGKGGPSTSSGRRFVKKRGANVEVLGSHKRGEVAEIHNFGSDGHLGETREPISSGHLVGQHVAAT